MRLVYRKIFGFIHLWLGLLSGVVIFIVAVTGAAYVFYNEISEFSERDKLFIIPQKKAEIPFSEIEKTGIEEIKRIAGKNLPEKWDWTSILIYNRPDRSVIYSSRAYKKYNVLYQVYINPYNGKVITSREGDGLFWKIIIGLHTQLLLGETGGYIVKYATLFFLFLIVTGIFLWWPKNKAAAKKRFAVKLNASPKRLNYDLHNVLGFYMCWIVIFSVVTGLIWGFEWAKSTMYFLADGKQPVAIANATVKKYPEKLDLLSINQTQKEIGRSYQNFYIADIAIAQNSKEMHEVRIWKKASQSGFEDNLTFSPVTGKLLKIQTYKSKALGDKLYNITGDLHYGWIFGYPSKFLMFFGCLIAASLPFTGLIIYLGRNKKHKLKRNI